MELHLLRHGATTGNVGGVFEGRTGGTLTDAQVLALKSLAFDSTPYDAIYTSQLARWGIDAPLIDSRLAERDLGIFDGHTTSACETSFPVEFGKFREFSEDFFIPQGESRSTHVERVLSWLADALSHESVLAVTSGGTIDFIYRMSTHTALHGGKRIYGSRNVALSAFEIRWPDIRLLSFDAVLSSE